MRSNRNPSGSARGVGNHAAAAKPGAAEMAPGEVALEESGPVSKALVANLNMPHVRAEIPMEWLDSANWRLPSGKALAEFALQAGFLAPLLFGAEGFGKAAVKSVGMGVARAKNCGKGAGR